MISSRQVSLFADLLGHRRVSAGIVRLVHDSGRTQTCFVRFSITGGIVTRA
jgi:hypothetical protein